MNQKLTESAEDKIAADLDLKERVTLKRMCREHGVDRATLYRARESSRERAKRDKSAF